LLCEINSGLTCCSRLAVMRDRLGGGGDGAVQEREREQEWGGGGGGERLQYFGKWFTENFSVNCFPNFTQRFSGQQQIFSVDFGFTAKQTSENNENILRKTFYVETNGALIKKKILLKNTFKV
jgi:hypothetical protein